MALLRTRLTRVRHGERAATNECPGTTYAFLIPAKMFATAAAGGDC